jgi:glucosamine-6-phosphate deaminase
MAEVIIVKNKEHAGEIVARHIADLIKAKPSTVLGLATGSTPIVAYDALAKLIKAENINVSNVKGYALDEYVGLDKSHPESYYSVINRTVTEPLGLNPDNINTPNGDLKDIQTAGEMYEAKIKIAGGVDLQFLGIGTDGHIGFNEPGSSLASRTRIKTLTEETRQDNARFFNSIDEVPKHCITQGVGTILEARHLVLLAFGENKQTAVAGALEGAITSSNTASALQLHPHATVLIDEAAAGKLERLEYYKYVFNNKPSWQGI